jgi:tetratricopeptide (TPR) repeat protein
MKALYSSLYAAATIAGAVPLFAQTPPAAAADQSPSCDIEQAKPKEIGRAMISLGRANALIANSNDATKDLTAVVASLNAPTYKNDNPVGRAFMLASAYTLLLEQPGIQPISPRSAIGLTADPGGTIDLYAAADSAITFVEKSSPGCVAYMAPYRQQKAWLNVTNAAINALNENKLDSAEIYARRSLTLDRKSPYAYTVLASVSKARKDYPAVAEYSKQVVATAGDDTTYADVRERAEYELASTLSERAKAASGAERKTLAREAIAAWTPLAASKDLLQATVAIRTLQEMYVAAGDSARLGTIYAPIIAAPAKYSESALLQAGVIASQLKKPGDAATLFQAALTSNPYSRDALNNLAASYLQAGENEKAVPIIDRLVALDPSNPDNYMLYAFSYVGKLKKKSDARTTKLYNDSLVYWNNLAEKMPVKVTFLEFTRNADGTAVGGTIENLGSAAKTYTLDMEFLDASGKVVASDKQTVGPVAPKKAAEFRFKIPATGVAGYRYKPIT